MIEQLTIDSNGQGLRDITSEINEVVSREMSGDGLLTVFLRHTSASLLIQENADPSARRDLEHWLNRLVPEQDPLYTHIHEGADDMPAHIKSMLTQTTLSIPVITGRLTLGTWQGIFMWEHRRKPQHRQLVLHLQQS